MTKGRIIIASRCSRYDLTMAALSAAKGDGFKVLVVDSIDQTAFPEPRDRLDPRDLIINELGDIEPMRPNPGKIIAGLALASSSAERTVINPVVAVDPKKAVDPKTQTQSGHWWPGTGRALSPDGLQRKSRQWARAKQTKRGKRGKRNRG